MNKIAFNKLPIYEIVFVIEFEAISFPSGYIGKRLKIDFLRQKINLVILKMKTLYLVILLVKFHLLILS